MIARRLDERYTIMDQLNVRTEHGLGEALAAAKIRIWAAWSEYNRW